MSRKPQFTIQDGLDLQESHLNQWKRKLNTQTYKALANECFERNKLLSDKDTGFQVFRGQDLTTFVLNYQTQPKPH